LSDRVKYLNLYRKLKDLWASFMNIDIFVDNDDVVLVRLEKHPVCIKIYNILMLMPVLTAKEMSTRRKQWFLTHHAC
jgi:hypothetical protein